MNLAELQQELAVALKEQEAVDSEAKIAQAAYDAKRLEFEVQNQGVVKALNDATSNKANAKTRVNELREQAKAILGEGFIDDLPEGFTQKKTKELSYGDRQLFNVALAKFPFLLKLDKKAVDSFFINMATEKDGALSLPEPIASWSQVKIEYKPFPNISNVKLLKLKPVA